MPKVYRAMKRDVLDGLPVVGATTSSELGVRPERIRVVMRDAEAHLRGTVTVLEPLGADTLVTVDCAGHKVVARLPGDSPLRLADPVLLALEPESIILFDFQTGRR